MSSNPGRLLHHPWGKFNVQPVNLGRPRVQSEDVDGEKAVAQTCYTTSTDSAGDPSHSNRAFADAQTREFGQPQPIQTRSCTMLNHSDVSIMDDKVIRKHSSSPVVLSSTSNRAHNNKVPNKKKKLLRKRFESAAGICVDLCSYELVAQVARECGMLVVDINSDWDVLWSDPCINHETHHRMKRFQRTNHFPLITELCRKSHLAKNLNLMKKLYPEEYNFFPATWILPRQNYEVQQYLKHMRRTVIVKPDNGSNGVGISLVRSFRNLQIEPHKNYICQEYIANPFLIDGYKFDIRVYTLMTSCDPLRLYVHSDGLARFATVKYQRPAPGNLKTKYMHLTNYNVNKNSVSFICDEEVGSKRKLSTINEWFTRNDYSVEQIWRRIDDVILKTVISAQPSLQRTYKYVFSRHNCRTACFQLLGFDILLDENLNPYVLEVNHSPSFHIDTPLDVEIKSKVLHDTFSMCNLQNSIKRKVQWEDRKEIQKRELKRPSGKSSNVDLETDFKEKQLAWEESHIGNYRLLYPCTPCQKYDTMCHVLDTITSHYKDTFASQMRIVLGRAQRFNIDSKRKLKKNVPTPRTSISNPEMKPDRNNVKRTPEKPQSMSIMDFRRKK